MITANIKVDVSVFLDTDGIEVYIGDDETPLQTISLESMLNEFIELRSVGNKICDVEDVKSVRDSLARWVYILNSLLEE